MLALKLSVLTFHKWTLFHSKNGNKQSQKKGWSRSPVKIVCKHWKYVRKDYMSLAFCSLVLMSFGSTQALGAPRRRHLSWYSSIGKLRSALWSQTNRRGRLSLMVWCAENENAIWHDDMIWKQRILYQYCPMFITLHPVIPYHIFDII